MAEGTTGSTTDSTNVGQVNLGLNINQGLFNKQLMGLRNGAANTIGKMFKPVGNLIGSALAVGSVVAFTKSCLELGSNLSEVQNVVDVTFGSMSAKVDEFATTAIDKLGLSETVTKKMMGTYGSMAKSFGFNPQEVYDMSAAITGLTADVASFYNLETEESYTKMKSIFTGETESLKELGVVMTQTALDQYAMNNGFGKTTVAMTEQEKVMLRYQFVMSQLSDASGDFLRTQDGWANQTRVLTLRFEQLKATLGQGFINLFTPIIKMINTFIASLQNAANVFLRLTEIITGQESGSMGNLANDVAGVSGAASSASENISSMGDSASSAAKEAQKALMGFDQIQKISDASNSGGGSSGGVTGGDISGGSLIADSLASATNEATKLEQTLVNMVNKVKEAWKTGDFTEVGSMISTGLTGVINDIKWEDVYSGASKFGKGLATFLNGLITPDLFGGIGGLIAGCLNTELYTLNSFGHEFDWKNLGNSIAEGINSFFTTFDFKTTADTINVWVKGALTMASTLFKSTDFRTIGNKIGEFLADLDLTEFIDDIADLLWESIKAGFEMLKGVFEEAPLEASLITAFGVLKFTGLGSFLAGKIASSISTGLASSLASKLGLELAEGAGIGTAITTALKGAFEGITATSVLASIKTGLATIGTTIVTAFTTDLPLLFGAGTLSEIGVAVLGGIGASIAAAIGGWNFGNWLYENTPVGDWADAFVTLLGDFFTKTIPTAFDSAIGYVKEIPNKIKNFLSPITTWISTNITTPISKLFAKLKENIGLAFEGAWLIVQAAWKLAGTWFTDNIYKPVNNVFSTLKNNIKVAFDNAWAKVSSLWGKANNWFVDNIYKPVNNVFSTLKNNIKVAFDNAWAKVSSLWGKASTWFTEKIYNPISRVFNFVKDTITNAFKKAWDAIINSAKKAMNTVINAIEKAINGVIRGLNAMISGFNRIAKAAGKILGKDYAGVSLINEVTFPRVYKDGGFPEEGPFFMNRGEIAGKFSNGKGVVANNAQIISGISKGIYPSVFDAVKGAMSVTLRSIRVPSLETVTSGSNEDRIMQQMLDALLVISSEETNLAMIQILKEMLAFFKSMNRDVYLDGEKVTRIIEEIINRHTDITGTCPIKV